MGELGTAPGGNRAFAVAAGVEVGVAVAVAAVGPGGGEGAGVGAEGRTTPSRPWPRRRQEGTGPPCR